MLFRSLKSNGFRWAPSVGAWQRQLTDNAIRAADRLECIKPLFGEKPSQLQKKPSILQTMREQGEKVQTEPDEALRARGFEEEWTVYHLSLIHISPPSAPRWGERA